MLWTSHMLSRLRIPAFSYRRCHSPREPLCWTTEGVGIRVLARAWCTGPCRRRSSEPEVVQQFSSIATTCLNDMPWLPTNRFDALTHLYLVKCRLLSPQALSNLLSGTPNLETLVCESLSVTHIPDLPPAHHRHQLVTLPNLRKLYIAPDCCYMSGDVLTAELLSWFTLHR